MLIWVGKSFHSIQRLHIGGHIHVHGRVVLEAISLDSSRSRI